MSIGCNPTRTYRIFSYKGAKYRISTPLYDVAVREITLLRDEVEKHIALHPGFGKSLVPLRPVPGVHEIVSDMIAAGALAGVGPMAAVAGAIAQHAAKAVVEAGADEVIIENGGDIFIHSSREVIVSLFAGTSSLAHSLAFRVAQGSLPLAVCSSSAVMGHSLSFGSADLVTVTSRNAALADASATALCNRVKTAEDIEEALNTGMTVEGVLGILIVINRKIGMAGRLPELIRQTDQDAGGKVTRS